MGQSDCGRAVAVTFLLGGIGVVIWLSLIPTAWGGLGWRYWLPIGLMDVLIVIFGWKLLKSQTLVEGRWAMRALYLSGSLGLLAFLVGSFLK